MAVELEDVLKSMELGDNEAGKMLLLGEEFEQSGGPSSGKFSGRGNKDLNW